jgi:hypothetical protein
MATITQPGKFEGEPTYVPVLWEMALDGRQDEDLWDAETQLSAFHVTPELRDLMGAELIPAEYLGHTIMLWETDQGFVLSRVMTQAEWRTLAAQLADDPSPDEY